MSKKIISEETEVDFKDYSQLSYKDTEEPHIELFVDDVSQGWVKVWLDGEMDNREYICLNYEIIYLDTLKRIW